MPSAMSTTGINAVETSTVTSCQVLAPLASQFLLKNSLFPATRNIAILQWGRPRRPGHRNIHNNQNSASEAGFASSERSMSEISDQQINCGVDTRAFKVFSILPSQISAFLNSLRLCLAHSVGRNGVELLQNNPPIQYSNVNRPFVFTMRF